MASSKLLHDYAKFSLMIWLDKPVYFFLWFYFVALLGAGPNGLMHCNF